MKKYLIRCDMEGVSGIVSDAQAAPSGGEYAEGRRWFLSDLNALISGLRAGGADEIHVYDEHFYGRNIDIGEIEDPEVILYHGKPPYRNDWAGGLDASFAGLILLGFHSMQGTEGALLNHTYEPDIRSIRLNGVPVGEIGMEAAIAGDFGVGLAMLTADSEGVREARALVGDGLTAVSVKQSLSEHGAICYPLKQTSARIYHAAYEVAKHGGSAPPFRCGSQVRLEVSLFDTPYGVEYRRRYGETDITGNTALACWAEYWKRKLEVQKAI